MLTKIVRPGVFRELTWEAASELYIDVSAIHELPEPLTVRILENEFVESRRWVEVHRLVWEEEGKILASYYERPATEYQEGSERDYDPSEVFEVVAASVTVIKYNEVQA